MGNLVGRESEGSGANDKKTRAAPSVGGRLQAQKSHNVSDAYRHGKDNSKDRGKSSGLSITVESGNGSQGKLRHGGDPGNAEAEQMSNEEIQKELHDALNAPEVPMVFRWEGGGKNVYITGTFNQWSEKIPMHRSGNDFTYIHELKKGKHAFKFIVDDEWRFAPEQPTVADQMGFINNFVDLGGFEKSFDSEQPLVTNDAILDDENYTNEYTLDPDDPQWYTKDPPQLPPHLRNIILNAKGNGSMERPNSMQTPQHVTLNHLYCSAIKDNLMVLGVTQRFRKKFITTVFYSPLPDANVESSK